MPGTFDQAKHPRGQPKNRGQFGRKGTGGGGPAKPPTRAGLLQQARGLEQEAAVLVGDIGKPGAGVTETVAAGLRAKALRQQARRVRQSAGFNEADHPRDQAGKFAPKAWKDADPKTLEVHARVLAIGEGLAEAEAKKAGALAAYQKAEKDYDDAVRNIPRARRRTNPKGIAAQAKLDAAAQAHLDAGIDLSVAKAKAAAEARRALYAPEGPAGVPLASLASAGGGGADLTGLANVKEGHDFFRRVAGKGTPVERSRVLVGETKGRRAFASKERATVHFYPDVEPATVAHEYGHHLEFNSAPLAAECVAFREARRVASGEQYRPMAEIDPGGRYDAGEKSFGDGWLDPYTGKDYGDNTTEIMSQGFTHLYEDPIRFAKKDPEHFQFVLSTLRKYRTGG